MAFIEYSQTPLQTDASLEELPLRRRSRMGVWLRWFLAGSVLAAAVFAVGVVMGWRFVNSLL